MCGTLLFSGLAALHTQLPGSAAAATPIDDDAEIASTVFESSAFSIVSLLLLKRDKTGVEVQTGVGTAFVWDKFGHVVTNYHCISRLDKSSDVTRIALVNGDGVTQAEFPVTLVASDTSNDIAVLKVVQDQQGSDQQLEFKVLEPIRMGSSADLKIGQSVYAIGNPSGLSRSLSVGVVSGLNRSIPSPVGTRIYGVIQTDATINAGNSGGPLLDSSGRIVGVNTATYTRSGTGRGSGIGFALPIDTIRESVPKLIVYGNSMGRRT